MGIARLLLIRRLWLLLLLLLSIRSRVRAIIPWLGCLWESLVVVGLCNKNKTNSSINPSSSSHQPHSRCGYGSVAYGLNPCGIGGGTYVGYGANGVAPNGCGIVFICAGYGIAAGCGACGFVGAIFA